MLTPGALTSGLIWPSPCTGPRELKSAIDGEKTVAAFMRTIFADSGPAPMIDFRNSPLACDMPRVGITDLRTVAADNSPSVLLKIIAATAPAAAAFAAFVVNNPVPRLPATGNTGVVIVLPLLI